MSKDRKAATILNSVAVTAKRLGSSERFVHGLIKSNRLPARRLDGRLMITDAAIETFIAALPDHTSPAPQPSNLPHLTGAERTRSKETLTGSLRETPPEHHPS